MKVVEMSIPDEFHVIFAMRTDFGYLATDKVLFFPGGIEQAIEVTESNLSKQREKVGAIRTNKYFLAICEPDKLEQTTAVLKDVCRVSYSSTQSGIRDLSGEDYYYGMEQEAGIECLTNLLMMDSLRPMNPEEITRLREEAERLYPGVHFLFDEIECLNSDRESREDEKNEK